MKKKKTPVLSDSEFMDQLCDLVLAKLEGLGKGRMFYTQKVSGSSPLSPTIETKREPVFGKCQFLLLRGFYLFISHWSIPFAYSAKHDSYTII
ncbi:hypothetical protein ACFLWX_04550 [Chloroflexota bacterium]